MSVLIVDDEIQWLASLRRHAELMGLPVEVASSGEEALALHAKKLYPVILTDIMMPGMNGLDFLRQVKRLNPTCIIYVMTGYSTMSRLLDCLEAGVADYFYKPFPDTGEVLVELSRAVQRQERWKKDLMKVGL